MQRVTKTELFTTLVGFMLMLLQGCGLTDKTPAIGYYYPTISLCLGMAAATSANPVVPVNPTPNPTPVPVIPSDDTAVCPRCKGTGKVKFGRKEVECRKCGGTGKIKKPKQEEHSVVDHSWLAPEDFVHDMDAYYQARQLAKDGNQCVLIDFAPDWCEPCQKYNHYFDQPSVIEGLEKDFVLFRVKDGDLTNAFHIPQRYPKATYPRMIVVTPNGDYQSFNPDPQYFNTRLNNALTSLGVK